MIPSLDRMIIKLNSTLFDAIVAIDNNAQGVVFVVDDNKKISGILTDGDIRRSMLKGKKLESPIKEIIKPGFVSCSVTTPIEKLTQLLTDKIRHIPLVVKSHLEMPVSLFG